MHKTDLRRFLGSDEPPAIVEADSEKKPVNPRGVIGQEHDRPGRLQRRHILRAKAEEQLNEQTQKCFHFACSPTFNQVTAKMTKAARASKSSEGLNPTLMSRKAIPLPQSMARFSKPFCVAMVLPSLSLCDSACKAALSGIRKRPAINPVTIRSEIAMVIG